MLWAINEEQEKVEATPKARARCPRCGTTTIAKCGQLNVWHWAHERGEDRDCDDTLCPDNEFSIFWKSCVPAEMAEVSFGRYTADLVTSAGYPIKLVGHPIGLDQLQKIQTELNPAAWIVDGRAFHDRIDLRAKRNPAHVYYQTFRFKHARKVLSFIHAEQYWQFGLHGTGKVLFVKKLFTDSPVGGWGHRQMVAQILWRFFHPYDLSIKGRSVYDTGLVQPEAIPRTQNRDMTNGHETF